MSANNNFMVPAEFLPKKEISLKEFNELCRSDKFYDGPWEETTNGQYRDMVYCPYKKVYGYLSNSEFVWTWKIKPPTYQKESEKNIVNIKKQKEKHRN